MSDKMKRFFECIIPVTYCNLKCGYCYIIQRGDRSLKMPEFKYSMEQIGKALTRERLGGVCYFSLCGAGETLVPKETVDITYKLLENGHYVNITTNGTLRKRLAEFESFPEEWRSRLHFAFSLHYNELIRLNLLNGFFDNVKYVKNLGCSYLVQINLCDEYLANWDQIKKICIQKIGAPPQVAATRKEETTPGKIAKVELMTELSPALYKETGDTFNSPLFAFTMENFNVKRKEFCYAGAWSGTLNFATGVLSKCYGSHGVDVFADPEKKIDFTAIGKCCSLFCMNSSHFLSLGVIPELDTPTYAQLRNREEVSWYSPKMREFLNQKLMDNNIEYGKITKLCYVVRTVLIKRYRDTVHAIKRRIKQIIRYEKNKH